MEFEREKSEFNSAIAYLNRINLLLASCVESAIDLNVYQWFHSLIALYRELSTEMKDHEIIDFDKRTNQLKKDVENFRENEYYKEVETKLYNQLHHFEIDLRKIMKQSGLQQRILDDAANALK